MRSLKILGLAAIAALASMAFIASSASADTLCEVNAGHANECPAGQRVAEGETLLGLTPIGKPAVLLASGVPTVACHSEVLGKLFENEGSHKGLVGLIHKLLFTACVGLCLKAVAENLEYKVLASASLLHSIVTEKTGGTPAALLSECGPLKNVSCLYELEDGKALLNIENDLSIANRVPLLLEAGHLETSELCPEKGEWDATYLVTLDKLENAEEPPVYITSLP